MASYEEAYSLSPVDDQQLPTSSQDHIKRSSSDSPTEVIAPNDKRDTAPVNGAGSATGLNSRSCTTCRKRKVKCDKKHPCSNCNRAGIECIFPGPGRAPRRSRKPPDSELLARLRRLEGVVQSLGKGVDEDGETIIDATPMDTAKHDEAQQNGTGRAPTECGMLGFHEPKKEDDKKNTMIKEFGRLVVEDGRSRYVSNKFWTSLSEEVAELRDILDDPTEDEEDYPSPASGSSGPATNEGFIFGYSSANFPLRTFHPPVEQIPTYWNIFKTNIDPVIKLLHVPHYESLISQASQDLDHVSKPMEVFMFTIYFSAITSLSPDDCIRHLGLVKDTALKKYRFATEQALARAGFLSTQDLLILQSLLLFLTCVRRSDNTRYVWTLTGLLIRLAQSLGVHRDGQQFGLSPFETELRRRLWWQICTLDVRASEDHGSDFLIIEQSFDTKFPLNINDKDINPNMKEIPEEHEGTTEMTLDLIRYSVSTTVRRLSYAPPGPGFCQTRNQGLSLEDKENMIEDLHNYLEKKYLRHCDINVPLLWVAVTVARLIMAKMWLTVHHPLARSDRGAGLPQETKDRLFRTSVEVIEFSRLLESEKSTVKWGWLFRTYVQWHALAFVLSELCTRTVGREVDKAWMVIEGVFDDWGGQMLSNQRGMLWKPLFKLMAKAKAERSKALQKQARFPLDGSLGPVVSSLGIPPGPMSTIDGLNDFSAFETKMPITDSFPQVMPVPDYNGSNTLPALPQFFPVDHGQSSTMSNNDPWSYESQVLVPERPIVDESMNWPGWDDMVKDYQMQNGEAQGGRGPDGMINWW